MPSTGLRRASEGRLSASPQLAYGREAHAFLATVAARLPVPSASEVVDLAAAAARDRGGSTVKQMMLRVRLASAGVAYLPFRDPSFEFAGAEITVHGARLDIGWRLPDDRLLFDENKSGFLLRPFDSAALEAQIEVQRAGAVRMFGSRFAGLRVLRLFAPERSFLLHADGTRIGITEGGAL